MPRLNFISLVREPSGSYLVWLDGRWQPLGEPDPPVAPNPDATDSQEEPRKSGLIKS